MPYTDAYGRTVSDDGRYVWDGRTWQPLQVPAPAPAFAGAAGGRRLWPVVVIVVVVSLIAIVALAIVGLYALVRTPSYGTGYAQSYQQQRAADESLIERDVLACQTAPSSCDRRQLQLDIRHERNQVSGIESFPFTPPCLVPEMNSELHVLDRMYSEAASPSGDSALGADLERLGTLRSGNPCSSPPQQMRG